MQKSWSEIKVGNTIKTGVYEHVVLEVGASGKTFLMSNPVHSKDGSTITANQWMHVEEAKRFGWTLHGETEKWEPKEGEDYWYVTARGIEWADWSDFLTHGERRDGLGIYRDKESAQAMFEKLKKVAKGE